MFMVAYLALPLCIALLCTMPLWLIRATRGRFLGVTSKNMSIWRAVGDFSIVFSALTVLANIAEFYRPLAECFSIALGHECGLPGSGLLFMWGFFFQIATIPLGAPFAAFACIEILQRLRGTARLQPRGAAIAQRSLLD